MRVPPGARESLDERLATLRAEMQAGLPRRAEELRTAAERLRGGDREARQDVRRVSHKLHGTAGSYGHEELGLRAAEVEQLEREGGSDLDVIAAAMSLVTITLRAASASRAAPAGEVVAAIEPGAPAPIVMPSLAGARIVAIDDDASTRKLLALTLGTMGKSDARVVERAEEALAIVGREPIDLVIVDAMMPSMTGLAFVEAMRSSENGQTPAVAFLSAATPEELGWVLPARAVWLRKPFRPRELLARIASILRGEAD
jgi:CheY-like chemotaxis protein